MPVANGMSQQDGQVLSMLRQVLEGQHANTDEIRYLRQRVDTLTEQHSTALLHKEEENRTLQKRADGNEDAAFRHSVSRGESSKAVRKPDFEVPVNFHGDADRSHQQAVLLPYCNLLSAHKKDIVEVVKYLLLSEFCCNGSLEITFPFMLQRVVEWANDPQSHLPKYGGPPHSCRPPPPLPPSPLLPHSSP